MNTPLDPGLSLLREQLRAAAEAFVEDPRGVKALMETVLEDVDRALQERLTIFPVAHHSPASGVHLVRRLTEKPPKVIFIELCSDLRPLVEDLRDCKLPVALQAFASEVEGFPQEMAPLSVVAPLTEFGAEYQAITYALENPETELVFVDRSVDHVFQWSKQVEHPEASDPDLAPPPEETEEEGEDEDDEPRRMHGGAVGVEVGSITPSFREFADFIVQNARVGHFEEWWSLYVERPAMAADTETYRKLYFLVGALIRRLGTDPHQKTVLRRRDRLMWTRMKQWLLESKVSPEDALFICGAAHAARDDVPEWGTEDMQAQWDIPEPTGTKWRYGFIPSSYSAIEGQFSHPRGTIALAEEEWKKALKAHDLKPFTLEQRGAKKTVVRKAKKATATTPAAQVDLSHVLTRAPALQTLDEEQLVEWCARIVALARKNRYLTSTADAIAVYQTSVLLAKMRGRLQPSPSDFVDAAVTCMEKMEVLGRKNIRQLCGQLLGADRVGQVGYSSLPPLVQDVLDRLAPVGVTPRTTTNVRVLMNFQAEPGKRRISDLLWRLERLLPGTKVARPIMGERVLGRQALQESWDVKTGAEQQRYLIQLAFEGATVEQVLQKRLREAAFAEDATTVAALAAVEDCLLLLDAPRLATSLGERATQLLTHERRADLAPEVFRRVRHLVHHFRARPEGVPPWLQDFVRTGYQHYSSLLPESFQDRGTAPDQLAGMLGFLFTMESLALSLGCSRTQLVIAVEQAAPLTTDPLKKGLLWAVEWLLNKRDEGSIHTEFSALLDNPMSRPAYPLSLSGFLLALGFSSRIGPVAVALLGRAFQTLSDRSLMVWMPDLITTLRPVAGDLLPTLFQELTRVLPKNLAGVDRWEPPWSRVPESAEEAAPAAVAAGPARSPEQEAARSLLYRHKAGTEAFARMLGQPVEWGPEVQAAPAAATPAPQAAPADVLAAKALLEAHPAGMAAWARSLE